MGADSSESRTVEIQALKEKASKEFFKRRFKEAQENLAKLEQISRHKDDPLNARVLINQGLICLELGKPQKALALFEEARKLLKEDKDSREMILADLYFGLGESRYRIGHIDQALPFYEDALAIYDKHFSRYSKDLLPVLEGIGGSYLSKEMFKEALPYYRRMAQIDLLRYGATHPRVGKSFNSLSDVFYRMEECGGARPFFSQAVWIFRKNNMDSILKSLNRDAETGKYSKEQLAEFQERVKKVVLGVQDPPEFRKMSYDLLKDEQFNESCSLCENRRPRDFDNWQLHRGVHYDAGFIKVDPTVKTRGLIVCLHGLGLNHGSYKEFASKVNKFGYAVVAIDVRGFGSLSHEKGFDKLDLNAGLDDLKALLSMFRYSNKDIPVFLLGESMGGALALQLTAQQPDLVDGLISSVPSGRRFNSKRTKLLVGIKLLGDPKLPFSIGKKVIDQATNNDTIKEEWLSDPANRLKLSPEELLHFESFMRHNEKYAQEIDKTPVIVFQGFMDHLVRPTGTYALYQALATKEKDLLFVGNREHLVFEEGAASDEIIDMLVAWLNSHLPVRAK